MSTSTWRIIFLLDSIITFFCEWDVNKTRHQVGEITGWMVYLLTLSSKPALLALWIITTSDIFFQLTCIKTYKIFKVGQYKVFLGFQVIWVNMDIISWYVRLSYLFKKRLAVGKYPKAKIYTRHCIYEYILGGHQNCLLDIF